MKGTVYSMLCTVYTVQYAMYSVQCTLTMNCPTTVDRGCLLPLAVALNACCLACRCFVAGI